jgi:hypothetical protein
MDDHHKRVWKNSARLKVYETIKYGNDFYRKVWENELRILNVISIFKFSQLFKLIILIYHNIKRKFNVQSHFLPPIKVTFSLIPYL